MRGGRRRLFTDSQCAELWRMYKAGESILGIGRALDRGSSAVRRVLESTGGISPPIRRRSPRVLSYVEREESPVASLRAKGFALSLEG
jgi:transposase, IS30 family